MRSIDDCKLYVMGENITEKPDLSYHQNRTLTILNFSLYVFANFLNPEVATTISWSLCHNGIISHRHHRTQHVEQNVHGISGSGLGGRLWKGDDAIDLLWIVTFITPVAPWLQIREISIPWNCRMLSQLSLTYWSGDLMLYWELAIVHYKTIYYM